MLEIGEENSLWAGDMNLTHRRIKRRRCAEPLQQRSPPGPDFLRISWMNAMIFISTPVPRGYLQSMFKRLFQLSLFERKSITRQPVRSARNTQAFLARTPELPPARKTTTQASAAELIEVWQTLCSQWFPDRSDLLEYQIQWSTRPQKRTLASCNPYRRQVWVARELQPPQFAEYLPALIYHEMCHAYLGTDVRQANGRRAWHGREFKALERRHPGTANCCFASGRSAGG